MMLFNLQPPRKSLKKIDFKKRRKVLEMLSCSMSGFSFLKNSNAADENIVKIGVVGPLTGPNAQIGNDCANGVRLAIETLRTEKIMVAGKKVHFEPLFLDDASDPRLAVIAAQRLCDLGVVGVVGHTSSGAAIAAARVYESYKIPNISPSATSPGLTRLGYRSSFRLIANDDQAAKVLSYFVSRQFKFKPRIALFDDRTAYGDGFVTAFERSAVELGMTITTREYTNAAAIDLSSQLIAIRKTHPDILIFGGMYRQAALLLQQMRRLRMDSTQLAGGDGICSELLMTLAGNAGTTSIEPICVEGGESAYRSGEKAEFKMRYDKSFPKQYMGNSDYSYDATMLISAAVKRCNSFNPGDITEQLHKDTFKGVTGTIRFTEVGDRENAPVSVYRLSAGRRTLLN